jgi:hypothetical protein
MTLSATKTEHLKGERKEKNLAVIPYENDAVTRVDRTLAKVALLNPHLK